MRCTLLRRRCRFDVSKRLPALLPLNLTWPCIPVEPNCFDTIDCCPMCGRSQGSGGVSEGAEARRPCDCGRCASHRLCWSQDRIWSGPKTLAKRK